MRRHARSLPLVGCCVLLAIATTAHAECAWVLWANVEVSEKGGPYQRPISRVASQCVLRQSR